MAVGAANTRNKLVSEGRFTTRGILFDTKSEKIQPQSYESLKEIAQVLQENGLLRVQIIGHTDADGNDNTNLDLSMRFAGTERKRWYLFLM